MVKITNSYGQIDTLTNLGLPGFTDTWFYNYEGSGNILGEEGMSYKLEISKDDGSTWYICLVSMPADGITSMSRQLELLPGMQATVNIVSGSKTILTYLMQPVTNIKNKAFRER